MIREFIDKKLRAAKRFRIFLLILLIAAIGFSIIMSVSEDVGQMIFPILLSYNALWICGVIYLASYMPFTSSFKWLQRKGMENVADDIVLERPTLPRSKIYCGQRAMFCKKPASIIPYAEIAWMYMFVNKAYGITVSKSVIIYTKDGKKFTINANSDEIKWLLENYVIINSPGLIIGYGSEQKKRYKQLKKSVMQ